MNKMFLKGLMTLSLTLMAHVAAADFYIAAGAYATSLDALSSDESDKALSVTFGWEPPIIPFLSIEASYHDLGGYSSNNQSLDVTAYSAQGVFAFPIIIMDIYAKFGYAKTDYDVSSDSGSDSSNDPYYAVGVALTMLPVIDIYAEYQHFDFGNDLAIGAYGLGVKAHF
ncbi:MAG: outer membrane beta-barrel protein [Pseudomonadales bacterium]|nr:outer membrane beta-barrel protein [Pseudomonadales bacterium]